MDKNKGQLKKSTKRIFTDTEVGVLLEDVDQKLGLLADGQLTLQYQIGSLAKGQTELAGRLDRVEIKLDTVEIKLDAVETRLDSVETKLDAVQTDVKTIKSALDTKADRVELKKVEGRVLILEGKMISHP